MFNFLTKLRFLKRPETPPAIIKNGGFFSTDFEIYGKITRLQMNELFQKSFQQPLPEVAAITMSDVVSCAMDEAVFAQDDAGGMGMKPLANYIETIPAAQLGWYASQGFIGYQICGIFSQHWLIDKACSMPARDAMRNGYELSFNDGIKVDPKTIKKIKKADKRMRVRANAVQLVRQGRVFGIRIAMFQVNNDDKEYYEKPFNIDGVVPGSYKGIVQIDPYWITPELDANAAANPASMHFYEPTWWRINGRRIHRTHLIIFRNGEVIDILKPTYMYGGVSVPQKIAERVYAAERTANEAPALSLSKRTTVIHTDLEKALSNQAVFDQKIRMWTAMRDNYGVKIAGTGEEMEQYDTSLADFDAVIMTQYQIVAAAAGVPSTKLLGTSPKGFNATGDFEMKSYHEELETIQMNDMEPLIERHHQLLLKSEFPELAKQGVEIDVEWNPVDSPSAKEQADINKTKADTASVYSTVGAVDGQDIRDKINKDKDSGWDGLATLAPEMPGDDMGDPDADPQ